MKLPSGWIFRPIVDRKGINLTLKQSDLVLCEDCYMWWKISELYGRCEYHELKFESPHNWFCAAGAKEIRDDREEVEE